MPAPSEDLPRLGRYQVINKLAAGGMAEVFLAKATGAMGFQRLVAIKLIHANFTRDQEFVKMFIDEARIAMHLHHRNIVQVFDLDKANDTYFIAMEFVHGVNLYDLYERIASKNRWIEPAMAMYLIAEISKGLHFAHTRRGPDGRPLGIVHRDISPQNVLLSFEGEVKITDFGIATAAERLHQTAAGIVKGKYAYMAPERLQEQPTDGRVDVFSAGVLLYELLVGENPFAGTSAVDTIENVLGKKVQPPSERGAPVSQALDRITLKALAKNPAERYGTAQEFADAVTEYALELTHARKDMAAGDAALAALLADLFPEKAKRPPGVGDPKSFSLPMAGGPPIAVATIDSTAETPAPPEVLAASNGAHDSADVSAPFRDPADPDSDEGEPTVLRDSPPEHHDSIDLPKVMAPVRILPRGRNREDDDAYTTREIVGLQSRADSNGSYETHPPSDPDRDSTGERMMPTPITPMSSEDILISEADRTVPTEIPMGMMQPVRKPIIAPRPEDRDDHNDRDDRDDRDDDGYAATMQSSSGLVTIPDDDSAGMPPPAIIAHASSPRREPFPPYQAPARSPLVPPSISGSIPPSHESAQALVIPVASSPDLSTSGVRSRNTTTLIAALLLVIAALVALAAVLVVRGRDDVRPEPVAIRVTSTPPGAKVFMDGKPQESVTPFVTAALTGEEHSFAVQLDGYPELPARKVTPMNTSPIEMHFDIAPAEGRGTLVVQPTPPDARVFVNGKDRGTGVVTVTDLELDKPITVHVEAAGYKPVDPPPVTLTAEARELTMPIKLARAANTPPVQRSPLASGGERRVVLQAPFEQWANVYYKGQFLGPTPCKAKLPIGEVELTVVNETIKLNRVLKITIPPSGDDKIELPIP